MGQNYNLSSAFGSNVTQRAPKQAQEIPKKESNESVLNNILDSFISSESKYEQVYNGEVEKQINMYTRQAMIVGMNLRGAETKRHFDMKI